MSFQRAIHTHTHVQSILQNLSPRRNKVVFGHCVYQITITKGTHTNIYVGPVPNILTYNIHNTQVVYKWSTLYAFQLHIYTQFIYMLSSYEIRAIRTSCGVLAKLFCWANMYWMDVRPFKCIRCLCVLTTHYPLPATLAFCKYSPLDQHNVRWLINIFVHLCSNIYTHFALYSGVVNY